jgi:hypothetical protein
MNENDKEKIEEENTEDDLNAYLKDMKNLESDFSDLDELDMEELKDIQEAIEKVREDERISKEEVNIESSVGETKKDLEQRDALLSDFSDLDEIDFEELKEMKEAIESIKQENATKSNEVAIETKASEAISPELEDRIRKELIKKKEVEEKEIITPEMFLDYIKNKRDKIWYHALNYLTFEVEDHVASKEILYDILKEVTSKSAIDPIPEHKFFFGLGYLLRLTLNDKKIIRYLSGGKFKININVDNLKELLEKAGKPISTRPIIEEGKKKQMFKDFLKDDFLDI